MSAATTTRPEWDPRFCFICMHCNGLIDIREYSFVGTLSCLHHPFDKRRSSKQYHPRFHSNREYSPCCGSSPVGDEAHKHALHGCVRIDHMTAAAYAKFQEQPLEVIQGDNVYEWIEDGTIKAEKSWHYAKDEDVTKNPLITTRRWDGQKIELDVGKFKAPFIVVQRVDDKQLFNHDCEICNP